MNAANCTPIDGTRPMEPYLGGEEEGGHGWSGVGPARPSSREKEPTPRKFRISLERVVIETTDVVVEAEDAVAAWLGVEAHRDDWPTLPDTVWEHVSVEHVYISGSEAEPTEEAPTPWPTNQ